MALLPAIPMVLLLTAPLGVVPQAAQPAVQVRGAVELSEVEAIRSAEARAIDALWQHFGPVWQGEAGAFVPRDRVERELRSWIRQRFHALDTEVVDPDPIEVRDSTVGQVFRQSYRLQLRGRPALSLQQAGKVRVESINETFLKRYSAIGGLWLLLLFATGRLDRATRGYMTGRIRFFGLALAVLVAALIYP